MVDAFEPWTERVPVMIPVVFYSVCISVDYDSSVMTVARGVKMRSVESLLWFPGLGLVDKPYRDIHA